MNDWRDLADDWTAQRTAPAPPRETLEALAARARREALAWRWTWRLVRASAVGLAIWVAWIVGFSDRPPVLKGLAVFLAALASMAWWAARGTMDRLDALPARSAIEHLRAQRARAAAMPRFVAIDLAVYGLCALALAALGHSMLPFSAGTASGGTGPSPAQLWPLWILLGAGSLYEFLRLHRSIAVRRRIDALLGDLSAAEAD